MTGASVGTALLRRGRFRRHAMIALQNRVAREPTQGLAAPRSREDGSKLHKSPPRARQRHRAAKAFRLVGDVLDVLHRPAVFGEEPEPIPRLESEGGVLQMSG